MTIKKKGALLSFEATGYVAIILIAIMAGLFGFREYVDLAKGDVVRADLTKISVAVSHYRYAKGAYPSSLSSLTSTSGDEGPWLDELPKDPWGHDYEFIVSSDKKRFAVYSKMKNNDASAPDVNTPTNNANKINLGFYVLAR